MLASTTEAMAFRGREGRSIRPSARCPLLHRAAWVLIHGKGRHDFLYPRIHPVIGSCPRGGAESQLDALSNGPSVASERCLDRRDCLFGVDGHGLH